MTHFKVGFFSQKNDNWHFMWIIYQQMTGLKLEGYLGEIVFFIGLTSPYFQPKDEF